MRCCGASSKKFSSRVRPGRLAGPRQPVALADGIDGAGFAGIGAAHERDLRARVRRKLRGRGGADQKSACGKPAHGRSVQFAALAPRDEIGTKHGDDDESRWGDCGFADCYAAERSNRSHRQQQPAALHQWHGAGRRDEIGRLLRLPRTQRQQHQSRWPRLAGQSAVYIAEQLRLFRSGARNNPVMMPMSKTLSDKDINDVAVYYEAQTPRGSRRIRRTGRRARPCTDAATRRGTFPPVWPVMGRPGAAISPPAIRHFAPSSRSM